MLHRILCTIFLTLVVSTPARGDSEASESAAALVLRHCSPCHGGDGAAPLRLDSFDRLLRNRQLARLLIEDGTMPPSIALDSGNGLLTTRRLRTDDRATLLSALATRASAMEAFKSLTTIAPNSLVPSVLLEPERPWTIGAAGGAQIRTFFAATDAQRVRGVRFAQPGTQAPIRLLTLAADPRRTLRQLEARLVSNTAPPADGGGIEAMGNIGLVPSGALGGLSLVQPRFELPAGFCFEVPAGDLVIETTSEPIGRAVEVLPTLAWIPARKEDARAVRAIAMPAVALLVKADTCASMTLTHTIAADVDVVAILVKGGAFLRSVEFEVQSTDEHRRATPLLTVPDFRMAFAEPWVFTRAVRVGAGSILRARLGFDNTADNPQQPSRPTLEVRSGLPPLGEDTMVVVLVADAVSR